MRTGFRLKHAPDIVTASRIAAAVVLAFLAPFSAAWFACYAWCGVSDALDGWLARRWGAVSDAGAKLDSLADCALVVAAAVSCVPALEWQAWMIVCAIGIVVVRVASLAVCLARFGRACFLHTWTNKAAGLVLFVALALVPVVGLPVAATVACTVAAVSAIEELLLMMRMSDLDVDRKGLWDGVRRVR